MPQGVITRKERIAFTVIVMVAITAAFLLAHILDAVDDTIGSLFTALLFFPMRFVWQKLHLANTGSAWAAIAMIMIAGAVLLPLLSSVTGGLADDLIGGYVAGCISFLLWRVWEYFESTPA